MSETIAQRVARFGLHRAAALAFLAPLLTRLLIGRAFVVTGGGKLEHYGHAVFFLEELGIPFPGLIAALLGRLEYYGGIALILGLGTRLVASLLSVTMVVALLTADRETFLMILRRGDEYGVAEVTAFVFLVFLLWLVAYGPGAVSLDRVVAAWLRIESQEPSSKNKQNQSVEGVANNRRVRPARGQLDSGA